MEAQANRLWDEIEGTERVKWSNWHITVNLNEADYTRAQVLRLGDFVRLICHEQHRFKWIKFKAGRNLRNLTTGERRKIKTIRARVAVEKGRQNASLHAHIVMEIGHCSCIGLDYNALKRLMVKHLGSGANLHCRFIKGIGAGLETILHYIAKTVPKHNELDL